MRAHFSSFHHLKVITDRKAAGVLAINGTGRICTEDVILIRVVTKTQARRVYWDLFIHEGGVQRGWIWEHRGYTGGLPCPGEIGTCSHLRLTP
eukprot:900213-Prorocentrum_minimum.AAC.1